MLVSLGISIGWLLSSLAYEFIFIKQERKATLSTLDEVDLVVKGCKDIVASLRQTVAFLTEENNKLKNKVIKMMEEK